MGRVVVPWFSKQEWIETYEATFSDDIARWKDAKDTMLVWQARVDKLPAGIDVTLPLLQAKIVETNPTVENAVKSIFLASAIQRFVSSIVKLPQANYYRAQSMHHLALEIGLPVHLVDLRNEIVHGHGGWAGGETVRRALETSFEWIKGYYWDAEFKRQELELLQLSGIPGDDWQDFLHILKKFSKLAMSSAKKKERIYMKIKKELTKKLESVYFLDPEECMKALVSHVLVPDASTDLAKHLRLSAVCECGCIVDKTVVARVEPLLATLCLSGEATELLLSCLVKKGRDSKLAAAWICIIVGSLLELPCFSSQKSHCDTHSVQLEKGGVEVMDWRRLVVELLEANIDWATAIAEKLINNSQLGFNDHQKQKVIELQNILNGISKTDESSKGEDCVKVATESLYTIEDVLSAAEDQLKDNCKKLKSLRSSALCPTADMVSDDVPVGILPHQRDNPIFYKELILHYDSEDETLPPKKRPKM